jgi:hypothetical protein
MATTTRRMKMDRVKIKNVRAVLEKILAAHAEELKQAGVSLSAGNASFNDVSATLKLTVTDLQADGQAVDLKKEDWNRYAEIFGMKKEWLGSAITMNGARHVITGLSPKRHKNCVNIRSERGAEYITSPEVVISKLK